MDIYTRIMHDHVIVKNLFEQAHRVVSPLERKTIFKKIKQEMKLHTLAEEKVFYGALLKAAERRGGDNGIIITEHHSENEHREIAAMMDTIDQAEPGSTQWNKAFRTLQQLIERHVQNEESRVFSMARRIFPHLEAEELGDEMQRAKQELQLATAGHEEGNLTHQFAKPTTTKESSYAEY